MRIIMNFIELEKYFIMAFGLGLVIIEGLLYFKYTKQPRKLLFMAVGLFWSIFMAYSIINNTVEPSELNSIIERSGTLFSISVILGNSLYNYRRLLK